MGTSGQAHFATPCHESVLRASDHYPSLRPVPSTTGGRSSSIPGCLGSAPEEGQPSRALAPAEPWIHGGRRNEEDLHVTLELQTNPADIFAIPAHPHGSVPSPVPLPLLHQVSEVGAPGTFASLQRCRTNRMR